jgi:hypothetical protein
MLHRRGDGKQTSATSCCPRLLDCSNLGQMQQLLLVIQKTIPSAHTIVLGENNTVKIGAAEQFAVRASS